MARSTYLRVACEICECEELGFLRRRCEEALSCAGLHRLAFSVHIADGVAVAAPVWKVPLGQQVLDFRDPAHVSLSCDGKVFLPSEVNDAGTIAFRRRPKWRGTGISESVLISGRRGRGRDCEVEPLSEIFSSFIHDRLSDLRKEAEGRVKLQIARVAASEEYEKSRVEALKTQARRQIGSALRAFAHLGDEVLREAVAEYVASSVMEQ